VRFSAPGRTRLQSAEKELTYAEALKKLTNAGRKPMAEWIKAGKPGSYNAWVKEQASIVPQNEVANVLRSEAGPIRKAGERGNAVTRVIRDLHSEYGLHGANLARIIGKETHAKYLKDAVEADILNSGAMRELITLRQSPEHIKLARGANLLRRLAAEDSDGLKFTTTRSSIATLHMTLKAARLSEGLLAARSGERAYQSYLDGIQRTEGKDVRRSVAQMQQPFMYRPEVRDNNDKVITKAAFAPDTKVTMRMDIGGVFGRKRTNYEFKGSDLLRMVETNADDSIRAYADNLQKIFDRGYDLMAESFRRNNPGKEPPKKMWYYVPQRRIDYETQSSGAQAGAAERRRRHRLGVELNPDLAETESTNARKFSKAGFVIEPIHALVADYTTDVSHYVGYTKMANEWKAALEDLGTREAITGNHGEGLYKGLYSAIASTEGPTEITTTLERLFNTVLGRAARVMLATGRVIMYQPVSYMAYAPRYGMARVMTSPRRALTAEGRRIIEMVRNSKNGAPIWERHTRSTVERLYTDETTSGNEYIADTGIRKPGAGGEVRHWLQWLADRGPVLLSRSDSLAVNSGAIAAFEFFKERNPGMSDADIANMAARDLYEQTVQTQTTRSPLFTTEARRSRSLMPKLLTFMSGGTSATYNQLWGSGLDLFRKGGSTPENVSNFSKTIITAMTQAAVIAAIRTMYSGRPKGDDDDDENATREFGYNVAESIVSLLPAGQSYSSATMAFAATVFDHPDMRRRFGFLASREVQDAPFRGLALAGKGVEQLIRADRSGDLSEKQRDILRENGIKNIKKSIWTTGDLLLGVSLSSNIDQFKSVADRYGLDMGD
jgi:hypothetical protein